MIMTHLMTMTRHASKLLAAAFLAVLMALTMAIMPVFAQGASQGAAQGAPAERVPASTTEISHTFAPLVRQASAAVVNVYTEKNVTQRGMTLEQMMFGVAPQSRVQNSLGSGVIVGTDGIIVTNNHVIQGADTFRVVLSDRREYAAELLLGDERTDLAVLSINTEGQPLPVLPYADTRDTQVGDLVLAIGNPADLPVNEVDAGREAFLVGVDDELADFGSGNQAPAESEPLRASLNDIMDFHSFDFLFFLGDNSSFCITTTGGFP